MFVSVSDAVDQAELEQRHKTETVQVEIETNKEKQINNSDNGSSESNSSSTSGQVRRPEVCSDYWTCTRPHTKFRLVLLMAEKYHGLALVVSNLYVFQRPW